MNIALKRIASILGCAIIALSAHAGTRSDFDQLLEDEWHARLGDNPLTAAMYGATSRINQMPSVSPSHYRDIIKKTGLRLKRLKNIDRDELSVDNRLNYDLLEWDLTQRIASGDFPHYLLPIDGEGGFITTPTYIIGKVPLKTIENYEDYLSLLNDFPRYFKENIKNLKTGLREGITVPKTIIEKLLPLLDSYASQKPESSEFYAAFKRIPESIPPAHRQRLQKAGLKVIGQKIIPAYISAVDYIANQYYPKTRDSIGITEVSGGRKYYEGLIRQHTTLDISPEEVHRIGLGEVRRIRAEMEKVIQSSGFKGSFREFQEFLRNDEQFYAKTARELMMEAAYLAKMIDGRLPRIFHIESLPHQPYGVEPVPEAIAPNYTTGRYVAAAPDSNKGGMYWVNTYDLKSRPLYELPSLTLHEGMPGHHLQIAANYELEGVPKFRKLSEYNAFSEGWGLYSEKLGEELGIYETPYQKFGQLSYEMWRACRLVVDTGMHALGWTREQAVQLMTDNTALAPHNIQTEINRYIGWPGQATAYKMGELEILKLRQQAMQALGDKFNVRDYHAVVLQNGTVPLSVLRAQVESWISTKAP